MVKEVEGFCMTFAVRVCNWPFENVVIFSRLVNVSVCVCVCVCVTEVNVTAPSLSVRSLQHFVVSP